MQVGAIDSNATEASKGGGGGGGGGSGVIAAVVVVVVLLLLLVGWLVYRKTVSCHGNTPVLQERHHFVARFLSTALALTFIELKQNLPPRLHTR